MELLKTTCADGPPLLSSYGSSSAANQVLVDGIYVVVIGGHRIYGKIFFHDNLVEKLVKLVGIFGADQNTLAVNIQLGFHHVVLGKQPGREQAGLGAAHENLHWMFFHFSADAMNLPFRHHIAVAHEDDLIGNLVDFVENV